MGRLRNLKTKLQLTGKISPLTRPFLYDRRRDFESSSNGGTITAQKIQSSTVVLLRHGQSTWNKIPTFSGWCDVPLTDRGVSQAREAGRLMKERGYNFDLAYSSDLKRASVSAEVVLEEMGDTDTPIIKAASLRERHYGALQGLAKNSPDLVEKYGSEQLKAWRRGMMAAPPPMDMAHPHYAPPPTPLTESLFDTQKRVIRYWDDTIVPSLFPFGRMVLITAHANSIRALVAYLDEIPHDDVPHIHVPNSVPCVYKIDPKTGKALEQDSSPLSKSKGHWILSSENQERLLEKLGGNSESFARSVFSAWDTNGDGVLSKEEILSGLFAWKQDSNPAVNALAGKLFEELSKSGSSSEVITLEKFQAFAVIGSRKHNLPFFLDESPDMALSKAT